MKEMYRRYLYETKTYTQVQGYYYDGSTWLLGYYAIPSGNEKILQNIRYGEIIYRYSKNENPINGELCFFEKNK